MIDAFRGAELQPVLRRDDLCPAGEADRIDRHEEVVGGAAHDPVEHRVPEPACRR